MNIAFFDKTTTTQIIAVQYKTETNQQIPLLIKRDDLIDTFVSGNKWRKLKYNFVEAHRLGYKGIASFGGAFSNHIYALACAGAKTNTPTVGFIRTHKLDLANPTLKAAKQLGMTLVPLTRAEYKLRHDPQFISKLKEDYPDYFFVPEGGSNIQSEPGLKELADELHQYLDTSQNPNIKIATAVGSGGTIEGLLKALPSQSFIGVNVVNDTDLLNRLHDQYNSQLRLHSDALFGGYGKFDKTLEAFCLEFYQQTGVPIEPVYTGKLFYALCYQRERLGLNQDEPVLAIHTGGLQGLRGMHYMNRLTDPRWLPLINSHVPG